MKILFTLAILLTTHLSQAQKLTFLDSADFTSAKPVVLYTMASWCSGNMEDYNSIKDTLVKYRSAYNLILLLDTVSTKTYDYVQIIDKLKPDKSIVLNAYFPQRLVNISENKKFTKYVNSFFNSHFYRLGPSTLLIVKEQTATPLLFDDRIKMLKEELNITHD